MRSGVIEGFQPAGANGTHLRTITVELLTGENIIISTEGKTTCSAIWNRVQGELVARGVVHPQIFGLAIKTGFDWVFVDPDAKVSKYCAKDWKSATSVPGSASSINDSKGLVFYCRVHFYLESLPSNFDVVSLLHYYLQLRQNLTTTIRRCSTNLLQSLAYALQAEVGDWTSCHENPPFFRPLLQDQPGVSTATAQANLRRAHQGLAGLSQGAARTAFIRSLMPMYNMHIYGMTLRTKDGKDAQSWIGVTPKGIEVYENDLGRNEIPEQPKITFLWASITKLYFERKKFEIRGRACSCSGTSTEKLVFTSWSESLPRHLLLLCRSTHQFHLSNHRILAPNAGEFRPCASTTSTTTSGVSSASCATKTCTSAPLLNSLKNEDKMLDLSLWADGLLLPSSKSTDHQRVSVISNASSNTTSGIVSDRVYSLDGSEEDLELRISDCCTDRRGGTETNNSTSLESLTPKSSKRHHHLLKSHQNDVRNGRSGHGEGTAGQGEAEGKYWYCDSDCDDDCCDTAPCRSLLVRTINDGSVEKRCAAFCECNSCLADEDDFEIESSSCDSFSNQLVVNHHHTPSLASEKTLKATDISIEPSDPSINKMEPKSEEEEHVYGEICEDPQINGNEGHVIPTTQVSPKLSHSNESPRNESNEYVKGVLGVNHRNVQSNCGHKGNVSSKETITSQISQGLTPKVASLKYLRTQRVPPWTNRIKGSSKNDYRNSSMGSLDDSDRYVEFDKTVQQGKYPSTRTVSDNFDTDSDYVQLPPLHPRRPPKRPTTCRLWKFGKSHHKSCGNVVDEVDSKVSAPAPGRDLSTLPRNPDSRAVDQLSRKLEILGMNNKVLSRSTNTLNGIHPQSAPEPPPKPKNLSPAADLRLREPQLRPKTRAEVTTKPVDARFITSKPQILIQTAYATPASVAVPGQAQLLFRGSQVPGSKPKGRRTQSQIVQSLHSLSMDNIYDTVASDESTIITSTKKAQRSKPLPPLPPKPSSSSSSIIIRPNNYIDVHASSPARNNQNHKENQIVGSKTKPHFITSQSHQSRHSKQYIQKPPIFPRKGPPPSFRPITNKNRSGSVPTNLHTSFYVDLQNLKPLSRAPIVYPTANGGPTFNGGPSVTSEQAQNHRYRINCAGNTLPIDTGNKFCPGPKNPFSGSMTSVTSMTPLCTSSHLTRSQIQDFKAQMYSDNDYVIFPCKDPRLSQQEYSDSKSLTAMTSTISNNSINDIPPPYLLPPPPYPFDPPINSDPKTHPKQNPNVRPNLVGQDKAKKLPRPLPPPPTNVAPTQQYVQQSCTSLYAAGMSSNLSQCSSSQYDGSYVMGTPSTIGSSSTVGLNAENLQKFLSTQSLMGSHPHLSSPPLQIYYPGSTHSAPPLPPYKSTDQVLIENGMRHAVQRLMAKNSLSSSDNRIRMKLLSRSEESLYSQPVQETEANLQAIYNLPPPPPYKKKPVPSPSEVDLTSIRQKCTALELPLLKALLNSSDRAISNQQIPQQQKMANLSSSQTSSNSSKCLVESNQCTPPARPPKPIKLRQQ